MSKRSKVVIFILISVVILTLFSFFDIDEENDENLEKWEEEIVIPDNDLDPLEEKVDNNVFIIDIALKIESLINKFFDLFLGFFKQ